MINAKEELLEELVALPKIKCADIKTDDLKIVLRVDYSEEDLKYFFSKLNFKYDNGYGGQEVFGIVWLEDGTWLSRGEYDGSEWWQHNYCPEISKNCFKNQLKS